MNKYLDYTFLGNTLQDWLSCLAIIAVAFIILRFARTIVIKKIKTVTSKTRSTFDDFLVSVFESSVMPLLYIITFYAGLKYLTLPAKIDRILYVAILVVFTYYILKIISSLIKYAFARALRRHPENAGRAKQGRGIILIIQVMLWCVGFLFLIDNLGYDITTLIAGLGIGGIAIALAAQTILGDLFSYLVIFFDRPFELGDFIIFQDKMGTVEYIGIKTTRIRTLSGEQLVCSNTDLTNSRIHNYKRMEERRVVFNFKVDYSTPPAKLKMIPQFVKQIVENAGQTRFDRAHFSAFGDSSLNFEVVFIVLSPDFNLYMDKQQEINLAIMEIFAAEEIRFAIPAQKLFVDDKEKIGSRFLSKNEN